MRGIMEVSLGVDSETFIASRKYQRKFTCGDLP